MADQSTKRRRWLALSFVGVLALAEAGHYFMVCLRPKYSDAVIHDTLVKAAEIARPSFPRTVGEHTTAIGTRVDGTTWVFLVQLTPGSEVADIASEVSLRAWVCSHTELTKGLSDGITIRYEYLSAPPNNKVVLATDIKSCS
jgi:hypothetical protein